MMTGTEIARKPVAPLPFLTSTPADDRLPSVGFATLELLQNPFLHSPPLLADTLTALPEEHDDGSGVVQRSSHLLHILWIGVWTDGFGD